MTEVLRTLQDPAAPFAAEVVLKATLLLCAAAAAAALAARRAPATRHAIWAACLAALLLLPAGVARAPRWRVPVLPGAGAPRAAAHAVAPPAAAAEPPALRAVAAPLTVRPPARPPAPPSALGAVWVAGVLACLGRLAAGHLVLARMARRARAVRGAASLRALAEECARAGLAPHPRLVRSASVGTPVTWGVRAPVIALPADAESWPAVRLRMALRHELAHVARRDALTQLLASVACALYWFHPGVWLAARRLRAERERACDDRVLATGCEAAEYAAQLLAVARSARASGLPSLVVAAMARPSDLEGRLRAVLDPAATAAGSHGRPPSPSRARRPSPRSPRGVPPDPARRVARRARW
jgi:beta-lactamase regulating signal transducer with metallopeptidase domain